MLEKFAMNNNTLPYNPIHTRQWLDKYFKDNFYKKKYDRFNWWRSYTAKNKPLPPRAALRDKILNGDFDLSPYRFEAEEVEHRMNQKYLDNINDQGRYIELTSVDRARRKRLLEDFDKDEDAKINSLIEQFNDLLPIDKKTIEQELVDFEDTLIQFYYYITEKYPRTNGIPYL